MRILVTGGVGFLGSAVVRLLHDRGDDLHVIVRPSTAKARLKRLPEDVTVHRGDLADLSTVSRAIESSRPDVVIHAAASHGHAQTPEQRISAWRDDVIATATLLESMYQYPPERLIHVCSSLVYRPSSAALGEGASLGPETLRGVTKLAAAYAVQQWSLESGVPVVFVRPFSIYGPGRDQTRVIPALLRALDTGSPFAITSRESRRDFVHVGDVARCVVLATSGTAADGRVLNVGTGVETSIKELVAIAETVTGRTFVPAREPFAPTPPNRPHWRADPSLAAALLGWTAEIGIEDGLKMLWLART